MKNQNSIPGKPDFAFPARKIAVFCDGDFWHGHNWVIRGYGSLENELRRYSKEWAEKIRRNIQHDEQINRELEALGWHVLRIWESDIKADVKRCGDRVEYAYWNISRNLKSRDELVDFGEDTR